MNSIFNNIKRLALLKLPPETEEMYEWVVSIYARRVMDYVDRPLISKDKAGEILNYHRGFLNKIVDILDDLGRLDPLDIIKKYDLTNIRVFDVDQNTKKYAVDEYKITIPFCYLIKAKSQKNIDYLSDTIRIIENNSVIQIVPEGIRIAIDEDYKENIENLTKDLEAHKIDPFVFGFGMSNKIVYYLFPSIINFLKQINMELISKIRSGRVFPSDEEIVEAALLKNKVGQDAKTDESIQFTNNKRVFYISQKQWEMYNIDPSKVPEKITLTMIEGAKEFLGLWTPKEYSMKISINKNQLSPNNISEYNEHKFELRTTLEHETRHMIQTLASPRSSFPTRTPSQPTRGLPPKSIRTKFFTPTGYMADLDDRIRELTRDYEDKDIMYRDLKKFMDTTDPRMFTGGEAKKLFLKQINLWNDAKDIYSKLESLIKQREKMRLEHPIRDIEFQSIVGDAVKVLNDYIIPKIPKEHINKAVKAYVGMSGSFSTAGLTIVPFESFERMKIRNPERWKIAVRELVKNLNI